MTITHKIKMDLARRGIAPQIDAVQGDAYTRQVQLQLFSERSPWTAPRDASVFVRYRRPDNTSGTYDTLPDGSPAGKISGNTVTVTISPEVLAIPGTAACMVTLTSGAKEVTSFEILINIQPNHASLPPAQGEYAGITSLLPAPDHAKVDQHLTVAEVTENGKILKLQAVDMPETCYVHVQQNESGVWTADMTAAQLLEVQRSGSAVGCIIHTDGLQLHASFLYTEDGFFVFSCWSTINASPHMYLVGITDTEVLVQESDLTSAEMSNAGTFYVTVTEDNGIFTPDRTTAELDKAYQNGYNICCIFLQDGIPFYLPLLTTLEGMYLFSCTMALTDVPELKMVGIMDGNVIIQSQALLLEDKLPETLPNPYMLVFTGAIEEYYDGKRPVTLEVPGSLPNPRKLIFTGAVNAEYDGSGEITVEIPKETVETETVLSDNIFDKSTATAGMLFYHSGSDGPTLITAANDYYAYVPLKGAGTYRTKIDYAQHGDRASMVPILTADNTFLQYVTGTVTQTADRYAYDLEFTITAEMVANGAARYAFDCHKNHLDTVMIVKDRSYPTTYQPYGYIEVSVANGGMANILRGKAAVFLGDSICAGTTVGEDAAEYGYGWAGLIGESNSMAWINYGRNGGTVVPIESVAAESRDLHSQLDITCAAHSQVDYILFEGGCNDADQLGTSGLGSISANYSTFDTTTFTGALEHLILRILTAYPTAKVGYIIPPKMGTGSADYANTDYRKFFDRALEVCKKWGIPCLDLWNENPMNPILSVYAENSYTDGQHLTLAGYRRITPQIEAFMRRL